MALTTLVAAAATSPPADNIDDLEGVAKFDDTMFRLELGADITLETLDASAGVG